MGATMKSTVAVACVSKDRLAPKHPSLAIIYPRVRRRDPINQRSQVFG